MAKKQKQSTKTCADCIHESACRIWTDGRFISDASASVCQNHETVKESAAYLCGVLDERKRKQTNADRIRGMTDEELSYLIRAFIIPEDCPVPGKGCEKCVLKTLCFSGDEWLGREEEWLQQPVKEDTCESKHTKP